MEREQGSERGREVVDTMYTMLAEMELNFVAKGHSSRPSPSQGRFTGDSDTERAARQAARARSTRKREASARGTKEATEGKHGGESEAAAAVNASECLLTTQTQRKQRDTANTEQDGTVGEGAWSRRQQAARWRNPPSWLVPNPACGLFGTPTMSRPMPR